jgi:hypothetical protein
MKKLDFVYNLTLGIICEIVYALVIIGAGLLISLGMGGF